MQPPPSPGRRESAVSAPVMTRHSHGLEQFFASMRDREGLSILDLAGANQANITFITNLGCRLSSEDLIRSLEIFFGDDLYDGQKDPDRAAAFLTQNLDYADGQFDGALVWDAFEYLAPPLLDMAVERLHAILRPGAYLLAFFHADERATLVPSNSFRISDARSLQLAPRGHRKPAQFFNNRALERLFQRFETVKFFLTRDHIREVLVKR